MVSSNFVDGQATATNAREANAFSAFICNNRIHLSIYACGRILILIRMTFSIETTINRIE